MATSTAAAFRYSLPYEPHFEKLLDSSSKASFDPDTEINWDEPNDPTLYGISPEWTSLYNTPLWDNLSEENKVVLSRHEAGSILSTGIWIEGLLQSMMLRAHYSTSYADPEFQYALVEIADECRHSRMFARGCEKLGAAYRPKRLYHEFGRLARITATPEIAFAAILAGEEALDIMQRDWMRDERVLPFMREGSRIHVVEEARHMKFARIELRKNLENKSAARRNATALITAYATTVIFDALINPSVYEAVNLDPSEAKKVAFKSAHRREMLKLGNERLMGFFDDVGLLTPPAEKIYKKVGVI